jgi:polysaccharide export outer membrane protein
VNGEQRQTELIEIDLAAALRGDTAADIALQPFDYLSIKELPEWGQEEKVTLRGEVRFPGIYPIRRGETLQSVLTRAGGLTEHAFPEGAVFARVELRRREQEQLDRLGERLKKDLASLALQGAAANQGNSAATIQVGQALLAQLESSRAVGRLVIDLPRVLDARPESAGDVVLRGGDELVVPRIQQEVTVIGEVQNATSHLWRPELGRDGYISLSGGTTRKADRGRIYVVRANGGVVAAESSRWFSSGGNVRMRPGDTVVVPLDTDRLPALPFWQAVVSIVYNTAIAAAAVNSF